MKWRRLRRRSGGVVDRRGQSFPSGSTGRGVGGFPIPVGGGIGGAILLLVVFFAFQFCAGGGFDIPGSPELGGADAAPRGESGPGREGTRVEFVLLRSGDCRDLKLTVNNRKFVSSIKHPGRITTNIPAIFCGEQPGFSVLIPRFCGFVLAEGLQMTEKSTHNH